MEFVVNFLTTDSLIEWFCEFPKRIEHYPVRLSQHMTFYNVISGILFMGAIQAFLHELGKPAMAYAATLVAIMCNEAVSTSELLEGPAALTFTLWMKILDLLTFMVLAYALVVLSPDGNTFTSENVTPLVLGAGRPGVFLSLLGIYSLVALWWTRAAGRNNESIWKWPMFLQVARFFWAPFFACAMYYYSSSSFDTISAVPGFLLCGFVLAYMLLKPLVLKQRA